ncbi:Tubby-related protein 4 [Halotydeus destructor]|nr:Tubby-related protein 4 [Halotydeus destructor]
MHLHFERIEKPSSYSDCDIRSMSWMGKVPDGLLQSQEADEGWKLNRSNYYQDGWLSTGNIRGIVGVTYTTCRCRKSSLSEQPVRTNYNLRGHRSEVTLVRWNEPYQKLATCDTSGIIFVWIKYEGRWSIELINDRSTQVTDFAWSHDGRMALICYTDGFVLVGSVTGQRYWSSMLNLDLCTTSCGIWTPDDQQVLFGTSNGHIIVIHVNGTMVTQVPVREGVQITSLIWSCEKFKMEDTEEINPGADSGQQRGNGDGTSGGQGSSRNHDYCLAVCFADGHLYLMRSYDDLFPVIVRTGLEGLQCEWTNSGDILAVAGHKSLPAELAKRAPAPGSSTVYLNCIRFYNLLGCIRYSVQLNYVMHPITSLTWGHNDKRLFVATGPVLHTAWVTKRVPSLQLLARLTIFKSLPCESSVDKLVLPSRLQSVVSSLFGKTIRCYLPHGRNLRDFVSKPPAGNIRLHCTMIRHDDDVVGGSATYVLYLEYLGGLVPILKGKRASKLKPEFVIFDPHPRAAEPAGETGQISSGKLRRRGSNASSQSVPHYWSSSNSGSSNANSSESEFDDSISLPSPVMRRKCRRRKNKRTAEDDPLVVANGNGQPVTTGPTNGRADFLKPESTYADEMPETDKLVLINSNIWGTKFKVLSLCSWLPSCLGTVTYRTSLLHLQPRQMTLQIKELGGRRKTSLPEMDGRVNSTFAMSEDDDENGPPLDEGASAVPIAPMTPRKSIRGQSTSSISPERKPSLYLRSSAQQPVTNFSEYTSAILPQIDDDLLTLLISDPSTGARQVTMEMTHNNHNNAAISSNINCISTQTSFQSVTELINSLSANERIAPPSVNSQATPLTLKPLLGSPAFGDMTTEDIFSAMAKKFQSELPSTSRTIHTFAKLDICQGSRTSGLVTSPSAINCITSPTKSVKSRKESPRKHVIVDQNQSLGQFTGDLAQCSSSCLIETRPVLYSTNHDIQYIDDDEHTDGQGSSTTKPLSRSPSLLVYKQCSVNTLGHSSYSTDFTNIRTSNTTDFQRRWTLKVNRRSHSLDSDTPSSSNSTEQNSCKDSSNSSKDKPARNCMSLDEEDIEEEESDESKGQSCGLLRLECQCDTSHHVRFRNTGHFLFRFNVLEMSTYTHPSFQCSDRTPQIPRASSAYHSPRGALYSSASRDQSSDAIDELSPISPTNGQGPALPARGSVNMIHRNSLARSDLRGLGSVSVASATMAANRSLPASPILGNNRKSSRRGLGRSLFYSPMMLRKVMKQKFNYLDCSSEDEKTSDDESSRRPSNNSDHFRDLESFQKANLKKKLKVKKRGSRVTPDGETSPIKSHTAEYRDFVLHNKAPFWNEVSQVYQLDFGGRVTQESAKNFQIEHQGKQVMQFGRIDGNAYTLDFQYPFSAIQALGVALANVTQRLK